MGPLVQRDQLVIKYNSLFPQLAVMTTPGEEADRVLPPQLVFLEIGDGDVDCIDGGGVLVGKPQGRDQAATVIGLALVHGDDFAKVGNRFGIAFPVFKKPCEHADAGLVLNAAFVGGDQDVGDLLLHVSRIIDEIEKFNQVTPSLRDVYELTRIDSISRT